MIKLLNLCLAAVALFSVACTDPTVIGGELIDGTQLPISYRDDIPLQMVTIGAENNQLASFIQDTEGVIPFGCINSPFTGELNARIGIQLVGRNDSFDVSSATIDSIVLILPLDTAFQLGDISATANLRVIGAASGSIDVSEPLTTTPLLDNGIVYGETTVVPAREQVLANVYIDSILRVDTLDPELRIRLNQDFSDAFLPAILAASVADTIVDSLLLLNFPGIIVEGSTCGSNLPMLDLNTQRVNRMGVFIYYSEGGIQKQYQFNYRRETASVGVLRPEYVHDFTGSLAEVIKDEEMIDTVAIVQSLSGLMVKVEFTDLSSIDNEAVNAAFLEIPIIPGSDDFIRALPRIIPRVRNSADDLIDYSASAPNGTAIFNESEGGRLIQIPDPRAPTTDSIMAYRFNLTTFFQEVIEGRVDGEIYLVSAFPSLLPGESIFVGPGGDVNALRARLLLATTKLP